MYYENFDILGLASYYKSQVQKKIKTHSLNNIEEVEIVIHKYNNKKKIVTYTCILVYVSCIFQK